MIRAVVFGCLLATSLAFNSFLDGEWESYKIEYNKQYEPQVEGLRRAIWESNIQYIERHNLEADRGVHTYILGINEFTDMTNKEFVAIMNGYKQNKNIGLSVCTNFTPPANGNYGDLPDSVDWRTKGYVTAVKNQGICGSCWSFSATGSLEGQHFKKTGNLVSLSEANLVDCSLKEGNLGCEGGLMDQAFTYVINNKGIDTEDSYPYKQWRWHCDFKPDNIGAVEVGCMDVKRTSEDDLKVAVATVGPISVAIDASWETFQHYKSGVYNEKRCSSIELDHGVLAVGYGTEGSDDYWLVKNSWGPRWGQDGYIMMSRNQDNQCGIASQASFPTM